MDSFLSSLENVLLKSDSVSTEVHIISCVPYEFGYKITFSSKNFTLTGDLFLIGNVKCRVIEVNDSIHCFVKKEIKAGRVQIRDYFNCNKKYLTALRRVIKEKPVQWEFVENAFNLKQTFKITEEEKQTMNENLNSSQRKVVFKALSKDSFKLIGPPGTGKTTTVIEIVRQFLNTKNILVCGPSNTSIDNIMVPFIQRVENVKVIRIGDSFKCNPHLKKYNLNSILDNELNYLVKEIDKLRISREKTEKKTSKNKNLNVKAKELRIQLESATKEKKIRTSKTRREIIAKAEVIFSTLYGCLKIEDRVFDLVIIDECCQAQDVELFLAILKGKQFILVGDPFQLGPVVEEGDHLDFYKKLCIDEMMLDEQYRMPPNLITFSNSYFYNKRIKSSNVVDFKFFDESNLMFIDTYEDYYIEDEHNESKFNVEEANLINDFLLYTKKNSLVYGNLKIGVIMPYSAQVAKLKEMQESNDPSISINTVDSFQGQERDIIIISLVRSNFIDEIGFMKEIRRMNVAITRCKKGLIIVGNSKTFKKNMFFDEMIEFLYENAFCIDPVNFRLLIT